MSFVVEDTVLTDVVVATKELDGCVWLDGANGSVDDLELLRTESNMTCDHEEIDVRCRNGCLKPWEFDCLLDRNDDCVLAVASEVEDEAKCHDLDPISGGEGTVPGRKWLKFPGLRVDDFKIGSKVVVLVGRDELGIVIFSR